MCSSNNGPRYVARAGVGTISVANPNLDGTGTIVDVIAGASDGTAVESINIQALGDTSPGMVRLFLNDGASNYLVQEIPIPQTLRTDLITAFKAVFAADIDIPSGWTLRAATEQPDSFNVIARGEDWTNCDCPA